MQIFRLYIVNFSFPKSKRHYQHPDKILILSFLSFQKVMSLFYSVNKSFFLLNGTLNFLINSAHFLNYYVGNNSHRFLMTPLEHPLLSPIYW